MFRTALMAAFVGFMTSSNAVDLGVQTRTALSVKANLGTLQQKNSKSPKKEKKPKSPSPDKKPKSPKKKACKCTKQKVFDPFTGKWITQLVCPEEGCDKCPDGSTCHLSNRCDECDECDDCDDCDDCDGCKHCEGSSAPRALNLDGGRDASHELFKIKDLVQSDAPRAPCPCAQGSTSSRLYKLAPM